MRINHNYKTIRYFPVEIIEKYGYKGNVSLNENFIQSVTIFHESDTELTLVLVYYICKKVLSVVIDTVF